MNAGEEASTSPSKQTVRLRVNGRAETVEIGQAEVLVDTLREGLGLRGTKVGCRNGDCGACTVLMDEETFKSCLVLTATVPGRAVTTVESLRDGDSLSVLQRKFWEYDAFQCGFCVAGHLLSAQELLSNNSNPDESDVRQAIAGNLCRCTGYANIVDAILAAARQHAVQDAGTSE